MTRIPTAEQSVHARYQQRVKRGCVRGWSAGHGIGISKLVLRKQGQSNIVDFGGAAPLDMPHVHEHGKADEECEREDDKGADKPVREEKLNHSLRSSYKPGLRCRHSYSGSLGRISIFVSDTPALYPAPGLCQHI